MSDPTSSAANIPAAITVSSPGRLEQARQLAEVLAGLHKMIGTIVANAEHFVPGEAVDELRAAWIASEPSLRELVRRLDPQDANVKGSWEALLRRIDEKPDERASNVAELREKFVDLDGGELSGPPGQLKRSMFRRALDQFWMFWNSLPRDQQKFAKAADAADTCLELGATVVGSFLKWERVVELISVTRQLLNVRRRRSV